ncbi:alpha/beta hydrolase [Leptospira sp. 201903070]|uniref:Alpha/beta hydrolase n=1 Tax=Leptospira ainlahdjerensis TaxID=2810033 RepID=A0ABS2UBN5_9LEPT|nr:alpha/beta hydrolase [Leptospira ainlahdjerensis]MBM9576968.1 alpha/beta hydrolase [Leptospira ainlahdjerensis]
MSINFCYIRIIAFFVFLLFSSCMIPEDLKKNPEESFQQLKEEGVLIREFYFYHDKTKIYGVASGCQSNNKNIIIFIHGSPGGWQNYASYLGDKNLLKEFCILSVDRPGFGKSSAEISLPDVNKQASILSTAILAFKKKVTDSKKGKTILVGHSYGGPIAARIASFPTLKIDGLLLLAAPLSGEVEEVQWYNRIADWTWVQVFLPRDLNHSNAEMLPLKEQLIELEPFWKDIRCETILIHGKEDSLVPYQNLEFFEKQLSKSVLKTISLEDEDHFIPWTQKILIKKIISEFVL